MFVVGMGWDDVRVEFVVCVEVVVVGCEISFVEFFGLFGIDYV